MSPQLQQDLDKPHTLQDDFHSFLYLMLFVALCLFDHRTIFERQRVIQRMFERYDYRYLRGHYSVIGGYAKLNDIGFPEVVGKLKLKGNDSLHQLIQESMTAIQEYHREVSSYHDPSQFLAYGQKEESPANASESGSEEAPKKLALGDYSSVGDIFVRAFERNMYSSTITPNPLFRRST
jgi:hypothetical protein